MVIKTRIEEIVTAHYGGTEKFLVDLRVSKANNIAVYIDGDHGITIDDCKELTRHIESLVDREQEDYELMVSSAGADSPMKLPRQFLKHVGRELLVEKTDGALVTGTLVAAGNDSIELEHKPVKKEKQSPNTILTFNQIKQGKIILAFK